MAAQEHLLILGASARAAAFSALRAGMQPWCADLFGDADLRSRCAVQVVARKEYPEGFLRLIGTAPPGPWMYTGGLENRRALVRRLGARRPLWGNDADVLRAVRSPLFVESLLRAHRIPCPAARAHATEVPRQGRWLVKPWNGAGGVGIRMVRDPARPRLRAGPGYFQEYIEGESCAGVFVGDGRSARLLGVTRQLVGEEWLHAAPFRYCGSIGPLDLPPALRQGFERLGAVLAEGCRLRGLFGVDSVLRDGVPWPVEVNPRYTASVEVLEHALGQPALAWHRQAFDPAAADLPSVQDRPNTGFIGKAILFARAPLTFPGEGPWRGALQSSWTNFELPAFADIPNAGQPIDAGQPILTFFARADSVADCRRILQQRAGDLDQQLFGR
jgi:predicted ATP-grasp superfamily ATP-dependent carboligase